MAIPGATDSRPTRRAKSTADERAFKAAMALRTNDTADGSTTKTADHSTLLCTRPGAGGECGDSEEREKCVFHRMEKRIALSEITRRMFTKKRKF